jgi:hypothetical protein
MRLTIGVWKLCFRGRSLAEQSPRRAKGSERKVAGDCPAQVDKRSFRVYSHRCPSRFYPGQLDVRLANSSLSPTHLARVEWREDKSCLGWFFGSSSRRDRRIQKPRVLTLGKTLGTVPPLRRALKGRQIECVHSTHRTKSALSPLQHLQSGGPGVFPRTHNHVPCEHPTWLAPSAGRKELLVPEKGDSPYLMVPGAKTLG